MRRFSFFLSVLLLLMNTLAIRAQQLTIEQCQQMAMQHYPAIAQFDIIEQSKQFNIKNANTAYLPHISLGAQATWQSDITKIDVDLPGIKIPSPDKDQYKISAEINQILWDGGIIRAKKQSVIADAEVQKYKLQTELYTLRERVNNLYFGILLIDERLRLHTMMEDELQRNYERVKSYVANGVANDADLSAVKVEQLKSKQDRIEMEAAYKAYIKMLSVFIGDSINENTQFVKPIVEKEADIVIRRPEMQMFNAQQKLIDSQKGILSAQNMPQLGLFAQGGYGRPALNMFEDKFKPFFIGGVRLSWNFGNLYTYSNDKKKIALQQASLDSNRETFLHNINIAIPQLQIEIDKYWDTMKDDDEIIRLRKIIREAAEAKVENGTMTVSDMLKEVTAEESAKQAKVLHEIQYLMSIYNLKNTTN